MPKMAIIIDHDIKRKAISCHFTISRSLKAKVSWKSERLKVAPHRTRTSDGGGGGGNGKCSVAPTAAGLILTRATLVEGAGLSQLKQRGYQATDNGAILDFSPSSPRRERRRIWLGSTEPQKKKEWLKPVLRSHSFGIGTTPRRCFFTAFGNTVSKTDNRERIVGTIWPFTQL